MERTCDKQYGLRLLQAFVFQVWLQLLKPRDVVCQRNEVFQYCNFTTKPAALLPFNEHYKGQEIIQGHLKVHLSNINFVPGVGKGEPGGAIKFNGRQDSYVEIEANEQVQFDHSMSILVYIYPYISHTGPVVHYKPDGHGVQMWIQGVIGVKGRLMARASDTGKLESRRGG